MFYKTNVHFYCITIEDNTSHKSNIENRDITSNQTRY